MNLDWSRKNNNVYSVLYNSDTDSDNESLNIKPSKPKEKLYHLCKDFEKMKICRRSYKNTDNKIKQYTTNKNILDLEKSINNLYINIRTDDKLFTPNKKPRNLGCGIYE